MLGDRYFDDLLAGLPGSAEVGTGRVVVPYLDFLTETLPKGWTSKAPHIKAIAEVLDAVTSGKIDRFAIHMPPRHAKTETVTVRYPLKCLSENPGNQYLITGYNERFARRLGRKARNLARASGLLNLATDKQATDEWSTLEGGGLMTRGVGSPPTGVGFAGILVDDPIRRREDAESEVYREKVWDWYTDDLYTRLEPGGWLGIVATLWHEDDVSARAVASEPGRWHVLRLPALAEEVDALGRMVGEALWPERFDREELLRTKAVMSQNDGERSWEALYQQNPNPRSGSLIQRDWLRVIESDQVPKLDLVVRFWDLATSAKQSADQTAGAKLGIDENNNVYLLDMCAFRAEWPVACDTIADIAEVENKEGVRFGVEKVAALQALVQDLEKAFRLKGNHVMTWPLSPKGDKKQRASPWAARAASKPGKFFIVRAPWNGAFINECIAFPFGKHDDQVDAVSGAFELLYQLRGGHIAEEKPIEAGSQEHWKWIAEQAGHFEDDEWGRVEDDYDC